MSGWIGPRRAMLLLAILLIGIGWYFRDYQIELLGLQGSAGGIGIMAGTSLIVATILFSVMTSCG